MTPSEAARADVEACRRGLDKVDVEALIARLTPVYERAQEVGRAHELLALAQNYIDPEEHANFDEGASEILVTCVEKHEAELAALRERAERAEAERDAAVQSYQAQCEVTDEISAQRDAAEADVKRLREALLRLRLAAANPSPHEPEPYPLMEVCHKYECRAATMGRRHGACDCGGAALREEQKAALVAADEALAATAKGEE